MSDTAERTARAGTEAFRRNAETMNSTWRNSSEAATRIAERSVDQFSKLFGLSGETARETMQRSAGNVQALLESSTFVVDGLQNFSGEWMRFVQNRIEENLEHFEEFLGCRTAAGVFGSANAHGPRQYRGPLAPARAVPPKCRQNWRMMPCGE
jgi:hypothetical protein